MTVFALSGGSGFVGAALAARLLAEGARVRSLDVVPHPEPRVESVSGDIRTPAACAALCAGADALVHAAAALPIHRSEAAIRSVNVDGTATLLAAALEAGVRRAIFLSSGVVYGLPPSSPVGEAQRPAPIDAYGRTKLEAERLCAELGGRGLETVVLRPAAVVGPGRAGVFGILFDWVSEGRRVYTIGGGSNRYQLLAVSDLVEAVVLAAAAPVAGSTYNVGATDVRTVAEELGRLVEHAGTRSRVTGLPATPARLALGILGAARLSPLSAWHYRSADRDIVLDVSRAERELGWRPARSNGEALVEAYDWYLANRGATASGTGHRTRWNERALALVRKLS